MNESLNTGRCKGEDVQTVKKWLPNSFKRNPWWGGAADGNG